MNSSPSLASSTNSDSQGNQSTSTSSKKWYRDNRSKNNKNQNKNTKVREENQSVHNNVSDIRLKLSTTPGTSGTSSQSGSWRRGKELRKSEELHDSTNLLDTNAEQPELCSNRNTPSVNDNQNRPELTPLIDHQVSETRFPTDNLNQIRRKRSFDPDPRANLFRFPHHQSPELLADLFKNNPCVSIKIDGVFHRVSGDRRNYFPPLPSDWRIVEGELFEINNRKVLFVFNIVFARSQKFMNLMNIFDAASEAFRKNYDSYPSSKRISMNTDAIASDMKNDINFANKIFEDESRDHVDRIFWYPKKYWKLDTRSWNNYIDQVSQLFSFVHSPDILSLLKHDGLVLTPSRIPLKSSIMKLKPKHEMSIDLKWKCDENSSKNQNSKGQFLSSDNIDYTDIIHVDESFIGENNRVYRLYPQQFTMRFTVGEIREPFKKANSSPHVDEICYKIANYFEVSQLKDCFLTPWYADVIRDGIQSMVPLFLYTQTIQKYFISALCQRSLLRDQCSNGCRVLDLGCGSVGQYESSLSDAISSFVGLDIDLAKLEQGSAKFNHNQKYSFILMDLTRPWNVENQNHTFPNKIWETYYWNKAQKYLEKAPFDVILSIFASQYANKSQETWSSYVNEINCHSQKGTLFFIMWVDSDRYYDAVQSKNNCYKNPYISVNAMVTNESRGTITVNLPHRSQHSEPSLGWHDMVNGFLVDKNWVVDSETSFENVETLFPNCDIGLYAELINWVVLRKIV